MRRSFELDGDARRDLQIAMALAAFALLLFLPGINWGMPLSDSGPNTMPWGVDELGPVEPLAHTGQAFSSGRTGNPDYPLFHYLFLAVSYVPYLIWEILTGKMRSPSAGYPYGFVNPTQSIPTLLLIGRTVSVFMGAGCVVCAFQIAKRLWSRVTGVIAGAIVMLIYPLTYYAHTTNLDVPALFWCCVVLMLFSRVIQDGLTGSRAVALGVFAALAVATKDQSYGVLLFLPVALAGIHFRRARAEGRTDTRNLWKPLIMGGSISVLVYAVASGLAIRPQQYLAHIRFIQTGAAHGKFYFQYDSTLSGYVALFRDLVLRCATGMGWAFFLAAIAGVVWCTLREREKLLLLLPLPGLTLGVFLPVRYAALRFLLPVMFVLSLFAARAICKAWESAQPYVRIAIAAVFLFGAVAQGVKGADLALLQIKDTRYAATRWLAQHSAPGTVVEYFPGLTRGPARRIPMLPRMPQGVSLSPSAVGFYQGQGELHGNYVLFVGPADLEEFYLCPRWVYQGMKDDSLGYELVTVIESDERLRHPDFVGVSPRIEIYKRKGTVVR